MFKNSKINGFKFYRIAPSIGSDTLQPLKTVLSSGKGHDKCGNSSLCQSFVCGYVCVCVCVCVRVCVWTVCELFNCLQKYTVTSGSLKIKKVNKINIDKIKR